MYISIVEVHPRLEMHHTYHIVLYGYIILYNDIYIYIISIHIVSER